MSWWVFDEFADFSLLLQSKDKKIRDRVNSLISSIVLKGRQGWGNYITPASSADKISKPNVGNSHSLGLFATAGYVNTPSSPPQGYTVAYQYGDNPFYFAVAYHPSHPKMGVIVKFSAYSWARKMCLLCRQFPVR